MISQALILLVLIAGIVAARIFSEQEATQLHISHWIYGIGIRRKWGGRQQEKYWWEAEAR